MTEPQETFDEDGEPTPDVPSEAEVARELEEARRYPRTIGGAFYIGVLVVAAIGIGIVWSGSWRNGVRVVAAAALFAATLRLCLPARDAGMLAVRNRVFDCLLLAGVGGALLFLASTIPNQPV
ncbi:MAG: putative integral rane protein [Nocardioides sp.]|nr:putative integral rane protein [Nocardioides sp.]